ncbi:MAG: TIGR03617 family F420-dependent LLM class oxidoreductase [Ilumatobacter sp.]|uniref:TIGR03617 family F420-dependent LLM class oxidoreductase n=1 Tax=Ilumatobacter sp. TaxID=1967498 RepID=UPI00260FFCBA|nr:TIGR03617 family F420-dependent LLM class oxidoreductase [Ilumatobacter sp.]MDJ0767783.1 TIGR03617 family F420-dependent LLM class oxidoreductase [Ilumatobacter sp.]
MQVETHLPFGKVDPGIRETERPVDMARFHLDAARVEELGFDGLVLTETKEDPFVAMAMAATTTGRIDLTTAVAIAFPRSPTVTAMTAWTLQRASGGRFVLGLGTQVKGHIERRYGMPWHPPGPWLEDYVRAVQAVWTCWQERSPLEFHSEHYDLTLMNPLFDPGPIEHRRPPIHLASVNAFMSRLAGRHADGVRPHPICTRRYISEVLVPAVAAGADDAGRDPGEVAMVASPLIVTAPTEAGLADKISTVRSRISFYASTRTYRAVFDLHGWGDIGDHLSSLSRQQRWDEMERHVTDEMVHEIAVVAPYDSLADAVASRYEGLCDRVEFSIPVETPDDAALLAGMVAEIQAR